MPFKDVTFGEWRPDVADADSGYLSVATSVYPTANGYVPMADTTTHSTLPSSSMKGLFFASKTDGSTKAFGGTATKLYLLSGTTWTDASRLAGGNYAVATSELWVAAQWGATLIAVNAADAPQVITIDAGANFAALGGSPPQAAGVSVVGDFVFMWRLNSDKTAIHWSDINSPTTWSGGLSDSQSFPDLGNVTGVYGDKTGYVLQERGIRTLQFLPGDTTRIFEFAKVPGARGCISPYGWVAAQGTIYYVSEDGFYSIGPNGYRSIGEKRVNEWMRSNVDLDRLKYAQCVADPLRSRIIWAFYNTSGSTRYDIIVFYDYVLDRFTSGAPAAQVWTTSATGFSVPYSSSFYGPSYGISTSFVFLQAASSNGTLTTCNIELLPNMRSEVEFVEPLVTASSETVRTLTDLTRDTLSAAGTTNTGTPETNGRVSMGFAGRFHKFSFQPGTQNLNTASWTTTRGLRVFFTTAGEV